MAKHKQVDQEQAQKDAVIAQLNEKKVPFDPKASLAELNTLLEAHTIPADRHVPKAGSIIKAEDQKSVVVGDPEELVPRTRPLVVQPKGGAKDNETGGWNNVSAFKFACTLNAYAYKNSKKWRKKKDVLVAQLVELDSMDADDAAEKLLSLNGGEIGVKYNNELLAAKK